MKNICTSILFLFSSISVFSQDIDNRIGLNWGIQLGGYFANNNEAKFYNGGLDKEANLNEIIKTQYNYDLISAYFNDDFELYELPTMKYTPNFSVGATLQYYTSKKIAVYSNFSITKLKAKGIFLIKLESPIQGTQFGENTKEGTVTASESRFNIDLGLHYIVSSSKKYLPFVECGITGSFLETEKHTMNIGNFESNFYYDNSMNKSLAAAFGYGMQLACGMQFPLKEKFYIYTGIAIDIVNYRIVTDSFTAQKLVCCKILM